MILLYWISFFVILSFATFCITFLYRKWALHRSILDVPSERSSHDAPVPRGGGIAFVITFYSGLTLLLFTEQIERKLFLALLPGLILAFVGLIEDIKGIHWAIRLIVQFICAGIALFTINGAGSFFGIELFLIWDILALVGIVWFINLYNFLDGIDGYASLEAISISFALWFFTDSHAFLVLAFSVGGFLYWNWPKAKIFMGDSGSTTLGYIIAVLGIYLQNQGILEIHFWLIITSLFWFDSTVTILRRIYYKENLMKPHKNHLYQRAVLGGFSHLKVMVSGLLINIILFCISFSILQNYIPLSIGLISTIIVLGFILWYIDDKYPFRHFK